MFRGCDGANRLFLLACRSCDLNERIIGQALFLSAAVGILRYEDNLRGLSKERFLTRLQGAVVQLCASQAAVSCKIGQMRLLHRHGHG